MVREPFRTARPFYRFCSSAEITIATRVKKHGFCRQKFGASFSHHHFTSLANIEDRDHAFGWTGAEVELLLEAVKVFATQC